MIGRFCGSELPKNGNFISTHNQVYLWFRSDNSTAHSGFELSWESMDPGKFLFFYENSIKIHSQLRENHALLFHSHIHLSI